MADNRQITRAAKPICFRLALNDDMEIKRIAAQLHVSANEVARALTSRGLKSILNGEK